MNNQAIERTRKYGATEKLRAALLEPFRCIQGDLGVKGNISKSDGMIKKRKVYMNIQLYLVTD